MMESSGHCTKVSVYIAIAIMLNESLIVYWSISAAARYFQKLRLHGDSKSTELWMLHLSMLLMLQKVVCMSTKNNVTKTFMSFSFVKMTHMKFILMMTYDSFGMR